MILLSQLKTHEVLNVISQNWSNKILLLNKLSNKFFRDVSKFNNLKIAMSFGMEKESKAVVITLQSN